MDDMKFPFPGDDYLTDCERYSQESETNNGERLDCLHAFQNNLSLRFNVFARV